MLAQWKLSVGLCVTRLPEQSNPVVKFLLFLLLIQIVNPLGYTPFPKRNGCKRVIQWERVTSPQSILEDSYLNWGLNEN